MQTSRPRKLTGRIISFGPPSSAEQEEMPFRPAYDLLEKLEQLPTPEEIATIGLALFALTSAPESVQRSAWAQHGLAESINREYAQ